jgi:SAM-dependent methyltransferase
MTPGSESSRAAFPLDYERKSNRYFQGVRRDFIELLKTRPVGAVLELGCGYGETGAAALAEGVAGEWHGVEVSTRAAEAARRNITAVLEGDVERLEFPWPDCHFEGVLMSEVLEHLVNPWEVVRRVARHLKPGAVVVASSPNVSHWKFVRQLIADRWDLTDVGPMDRTHLRWFTRDSYRRMFEDAGIAVDRVDPMSGAGPWGTAFNAATLGRLKHLTIRQVRIIGRKR